MSPEQVRDLEAACRMAIAVALRNAYPQAVPPRLLHLMAKAAVTVLEAAQQATGVPELPGSRKTDAWDINEALVRRIQEFFERHRTDPFVRLRIATNLAESKPPVTREAFWECMVGCLLTTQQKSGPTSAVARFIQTRPSPLALPRCEEQAELAAFVTSVLTEFGGLRRTTRIGKEVAENMTFLREGGWERTLEAVEEVRCNPVPEVERRAANFINDHFRGFGPKQSRNLLQGLGLSRYEIPIDSRVMKWLTEQGLPVRSDGNSLSDRRYYEYLSDEFQRLSAACGVVPCVLDAAVFASFDGGGWTEENAVW